MNRLLLLLFSLAIFSCKSNDVQPETYQKYKIILGTGGGFSGQVSRYCILDNGMLYGKAHSDTAFNYISTIKSNKAKQLIGNFKAMGLDTLDTNKPGNVYRFVEYHDNADRHTLVWNPYMNDRMDDLNNYYNTLMQLFTVKNK